MIKTVILDWGGVLIDQPLDALIEYCAESLGIKTNSLKNVFSEDVPMFREFQKGTILEKSLWKKICGKLKINEPSSKSLWKEAVSSVFRDKKGVYRLIENLKKNGYKIAFLSNTEIPAMEYFYENKYEKYFDIIVFSCVEKISKPDSKIYYIILDKLQNKPKETIFIDNNLENVEGAIRVGMHGILFESLQQLKENLIKFQIKIK